MLDRMVCHCASMARGQQLMYTSIVRVSAKELTSLILDEERLRAERQDRKSWKSRVTGIDEFAPPGYGSGGEPARPRHKERENRPRRTDDEDLEYKLAIEASKNEAEEDRKRRERNSGVSPDDDDLEKAIRLSREEEELRRRELEETNAASLFDDTPAQPAASQPTGYNQGYQQQGAVDWFGNLVDTQQPQNTGFLNNAYSTPTGMQGQQTGFQNGYGYGAYQQQPQQTGFDQYPSQQNYLQPQTTAFNMNNPYQQPNGFGAAPLEQQPTLQPGSHNPWATPQPQESVKPQPTGSNNPFASSLARPQPTTQPSQRAPTLSTLAEQTPSTSFPAFPSQPPQQQPPRDQNPAHAHLNALLAAGEGQDTFGNVGNLRIPAQHTAPGTFVNSAGIGANRLTANATGNNPFLNSQFTGLPQQNRIMPAQTGPAGVYGGGNPFGGQQGGGQQQQHQQHQQQGSLIDL